MSTSSPGEMPRKILDWAKSKTVGGVSEIAVLVPVRRGCPPGERRSYEECLAAAIQNLADRHLQGLPNELNRIPAIHFGRMIIIRPEQYLLYSDLSDVAYYADSEKTNLAGGKIPKPIDDYLEGESRPAKARSFLLTLVEFDGDLKVYMHDIAEFLARDFDKIFVNCEDFPGTSKFEQFWLWIKRYQINTNLFYAPYSNLSTARIKQLEDFKRRFDALVARIYSPEGTRARSVEELFDEFLRHSEQYARNFPSPAGLFETEKS
jgi:hypothetical protein